MWECCRTVSVLGRPIEWRRLYFGRVLVHARVRQSWTSHDSQGQREEFIVAAFIAETVQQWEDLRAVALAKLREEEAEAQERDDVWSRLGYCSDDLSCLARDSQSRSPLCVSNTVLF